MSSHKKKKREQREEEFPLSPSAAAFHTVLRQGQIIKTKHLKKANKSAKAVQAEIQK